MLHQKNAKNNSITEFWFKLSKDVYQLEVKIDALGQKDEIIPDSDTIYLDNKWYLLAGYENVEYSKWSFMYQGIQLIDKHPFRTIVNYNI